MTEQNTTQLTEEQLKVQKQLQERMDELSRSSYSAGYADALLTSLNSFKEMYSYLGKNIQSVEEYLKSELKVTQEQIDNVGKVVTDNDSTH